MISFLQVYWCKFTVCVIWRLGLVIEQMINISERFAEHFNGLFFDNLTKIIHEEGSIETIIPE